jgi:Raf kinase inhibitor-like YbhB/YbcL family protein
MKKLLIFTFCLGIGAQGESAMKINSSSFTDGAKLPRAYVYTDCNGSNKSPQLSWSDVPTGTKSFAIICHDPDAPGGTFYHWVLFNVPASATSLPEKLSKDAQLSNGALQGRNDFRKIGYDGPCPPSGVHRYVFTVYALDTTLSLGAHATTQDVLDALQGHILDRDEIVGKYSAADVAMTRDG